MKFQLSFKTPDVLDQLDEVLDPDDQEAARETARQYLQYGEYLRVEFDTDTETATVVKQ